MSDSIESRYEILQKRIQMACQKAGRKEDEIRLLAVSKGRSVEDITRLYCLGQRDFGENYVDELLLKKNALEQECPGIRWHFIGQIQTNKAKKIASVDFVHSVSNKKQIESLAKHRSLENPLFIFLQINLDEDEKRGGATAYSLKEIFDQIQARKELQLKGLMVVLPLLMETNPQIGFQQVLSIKAMLEKEANCPLLELSMGMSQDFEEAIGCGTTWIRIGSLLFGAGNK